MSSLGGKDAFVAKLTDDGDIVWARSFGGEGDDYGATVAADTLGRVYFAMNAGGPMAIENDTLDWGMVIAGCGVDGSTRWVHQPAASVGKLPGWVSDIAIGPGDGLTVVGSVYCGGTDVLVAKFDASRVGVANQSEIDLPDAVILEGNYPNPFTSATTISFTIPFSTHIDLRIYDVLGREVATLADRVFGAGRHTATWSAEQLPNGFYIAELLVNGEPIRSHLIVRL